MFLAMAIAAGAIYYGTGVGQMYMHYYEFEDAFKQEVRFASQHSDEEIKTTCSRSPIRCELPDDAQTIDLKRKDHHILIWNKYMHHVDLALLLADFYFNPKAEGDI